MKILIKYCILFLLSYSGYYIFKINSEHRHIKNLLDLYDFNVRYANDSTNNSIIIIDKGEKKVSEIIKFLKLNETNILFYPDTCILPDYTQVDLIPYNNLFNFKDFKLSKIDYYKSENYLYDTVYNNALSYLNYVEKEDKNDFIRLNYFINVKYYFDKLTILNANKFTNNLKVVDSAYSYETIIIADKINFYNSVNKLSKYNYFDSLLYFLNAIISLQEDDYIVNLLDFPFDLLVNFLYFIIILYFSMLLSKKRFYPFIIFNKLIFVVIYAILNLFLPILEEVSNTIFSLDYMMISILYLPEIIYFMQPPKQANTLTNEAFNTN